MSIPVSDELVRKLNRAGMTRATAGTVGPRGMDAQPAGTGAAGKVRGAKAPPVYREVNTAWEEATLDMAAIATTKGARIIREAPFLLIMEGGRA